MSVRLPYPIDVYVRLESSRDAGDVSECFAPDAVVRDEGGTHQGLSAIAEWRAAAKRKYGHSIAPLEVIEKDGKTVLKARLSGNFPGSPVTLDFSFVLTDRKIASLEIN